jgi:hypothetical protein
MSIFDGVGDPLPWVQEKALRALGDTARFVDLANEPDTTTWYRTRLRELAGPLVNHLARVVAFLYGVDTEAASHAEWEAILRSGTFGLAKWCKRWKIVDPVAAAVAPFAQSRSDEDTAEKAEAPPDEIREADTAESDGLRLEIHRVMAGKMVRPDLPEAARRLLCWLLYNLGLSPFADIAVVSKKFLPTDIGLTPDETLAGYRALYDLRLVERVVGLPNLRDDALALRLVVGDLNASKHPAAYRDEVFSFPGARIGGEPTIGNELRLHLSDTLAASLRWLGGDDDAVELRDALQAGVGADRVHVETVRVDTAKDVPVVRVRARYRLEEDDRAMTAALTTVAEAWVRERVVRGR